MRKIMNRKKRKKAQLKIQEMAFMLIALVFLFAIILIFYVNFTISKIQKEAEILKEKRAIEKVKKLTRTPEFLSVDGIGVDLDKVLVLRDMPEYEELWEDLVEIKIIRLYPEMEEYIIYEKNVRYSESFGAFISLCQTIYKEDIGIWQDCDLARLIVSIETEEVI